MRTFTLTVMFALAIQGGVFLAAAREHRALPRACHCAKVIFLRR